MRSPIFSALAVASMISLAGCGDGDQDSAMPDTTATSSMPAPADTVTATPAVSQYPMVGGAEMLPSRDIVDNAVNSKDHTTLVAAVKAAGLVETLKGAGPFTVFAPVNAAFEKLPAGTVDELLKPASKEKLTKILTYHVVPGKLDSAEIARLIQEGNGTASVKTVNGETISVMMDNNKIAIKDKNRGKAYVNIGNVYQSNGVIHVIDAVLMP